jgi:hypothetical protein
MAEQAVLQAALQRLEGALARLDEAAAALVEAADEQARRQRGEARMAADRARLAEALDAATARVERVENSRRDAARRLEQAIEAVRGLLGESGARSSGAGS